MLSTWVDDATGAAFGGGWWRDLEVKVKREFVAGAICNDTTYLSMYGCRYFTLLFHAAAAAAKDWRSFPIFSWMWIDDMQNTGSASYLSTVPPRLATLATYIHIIIFIV